MCTIKMLIKVTLKKEKLHLSHEIIGFLRKEITPHSNGLVLPRWFYLNGGLKPRKALFLNFVTALTAVAGGIAGYYLFPYLGSAMTYLLPFAAGGFLYIAASDLVPELHKEVNTVKTVMSFASFLAGIILMWNIKLVFGG